MISGVLGIIGVLDLYTHYPVRCIMGWHRRQMREQSPGRIINDNLVLHCNLDLSDKIKIFSLVVMGDAVAHGFTCGMGSATAEGSSIVQQPIEFQVTGRHKSLPLSKCTLAVPVHGRHRCSLSLIPRQENISSIYLTAAV
jgi:hypothetical protein